MSAATTLRGLIERATAGPWMTISGGGEISIVKGDRHTPQSEWSPITGPVDGSLYGTGRGQAADDYQLIVYLVNNAEALAECLAAAETRARYTHSDSCDSWRGDGCTCGLDALTTALASLQENRDVSSD